MSKSWDNGILKKLKALVGKGLSTAEIGKKLGISKNAVVGKLHRMGWNSESTPAKPKQETTKKTVLKAPTKKTTPIKPTRSPKPAQNTKITKTVKSGTKATGKASTKTTKVVVEDKPQKAVGRSISVRGTNVHQRIVQHALEMANLKPNQCRWPIGDPDSEDFHFCGNTVFVGKPYCYEHCKQAYQFTPPKKK